MTPIADFPPKKETPEVHTKGSKHLRVSELIAVLLKLPQSMYVKTEGCDCIGPCVGAYVNKDESKWYDNCVILERNDTVVDMTEKPPQPNKPANYD
jgi:hypothetical protein